MLYGLESAALRDTALNRLNTFNLKGLRKILKLTTTAGQTIQGLDRSNDNATVYKKAEEAINEDTRILLDNSKKKTKTRLYLLQ